MSVASQTPLPQLFAQSLAQVASDSSGLQKPSPQMELVPQRRALA
jgi:hypothetical protein